MEANNSIDFVSTSLHRQLFSNALGPPYGSIATPALPCVNLSFTYDGTFTILGFSGRSLSETTPALVTLALNSSWGLSKTYSVTSNVSFNTVSGARFGVTDSVDWSDPIPFYLYVVADVSDSSVVFMISRNPCAVRTPAVSKISKAGSVVNTGVDDFYSLENVTLGNYANSSCTCIGSFRMTFSGGSSTWNVASFQNGDGINRYQDGNFVMAAGQNGAASGTYVLANAGTEPQFATNTVNYSVRPNGQIWLSYVLDNATVPGVGAQNISLILPCPSYTTTQLRFMFFDGTTYRTSFCRITAGNSYADLFLDSAAAQMTNAEVIAGSTLRISGVYQGWISTP